MPMMCDVLLADEVLDVGHAFAQSFTAQDHSPWSQNTILHRLSRPRWLERVSKVAWEQFKCLQRVMDMV
jgi:hypothetical protein